MDVMQALLVEMEASVAKVQERMQKPETRGERAARRAVVREVAMMKEMEKKDAKLRDTKEAKEMAIGVILAVEGLRMRDLEIENKKQKEEIQKLKEERDMLEWCVDKEWWFGEWLYNRGIIDVEISKEFDEVYKEEFDKGGPSAYELGNVGDYDKFH